MLSPKSQHNLPYIIPFIISTALYLWYAFLSDTSISDSVLSYHQDQAMSANWWQLITAHFMHNNFIHYAINMLGLGLLWLLHKEYASSISFSLNFLFICLGTSVCIFIFSPNISWYVGMSGVLHGIFAWGVIIDMYYKRKSAYLLLVGLIVKLIDEQYFASSSFMAELIEVGVAVNAHLYGSIFGIFSGLIGASMLHFSDKQSHA